MKAFAARKDFKDRSRLRTLCLGRLLCHVPAKASTEIFMAFQLQKTPNFCDRVYTLSLACDWPSMCSGSTLSPRTQSLGREAFSCVRWHVGGRGLGGNGFSAIELLAYGCKGVNQDLSTTARSGRI